ncbi:hypothetical protein AGMMS49975_08820 [Clostridia bacterium]|nr:hypothetical protein AGMMS49975_08820 [Clostridia bacterium]
MANYDLSKLALQMAFPTNDILYDDVGDPSVMVKIPKFKVSDVIAGGSDSTHPAFIVNGVEKPFIWISKYQNIVNNGRAYSLPAQDPATYTTFDQAWQYCKQKGPGWHLMTNAEFAALALWCKMNGFMPNGNNNYGKDISESALPPKALPTLLDSQANNYRTLRTATGSGPVTWYHDNTPAGIADLNGNVWEWNNGLRLVSGEIQILANNDAADWNNPVNSVSTLWKAIMPNGTLVAPGTSGTLKWDYLTSKIMLTANAVTDTANASRSTNFELLGKDASVATVPEILKSLAIYPAETGYSSDNVWANMTDERLPQRGGPFVDGASAGVFALYFNSARSVSSIYGGFRAAFCNL